jgi:hypothetical protein
MSDNTPPPITDAMREEAKRQKKEWFYVIDPDYAPFGAEKVPVEGYIGAYHCDSEGNITDEFSPNEHYKSLPPTEAWKKYQENNYQP